MEMKSAKWVTDARILLASLILTYPEITPRQYGMIGKLNGQAQKLFQAKTIRYNRPHRLAAKGRSKK